MAAPVSGLLETAPGGLPLVQTSGLNTNKAVNFSGMQVDTSGNTTVPTVLNANGSSTQLGAINYGYTSLLSGATVNVNPSLGSLFGYTVVGTTSVVATSAPTIAQPIYMEFIQGVSGVSAAITFGTNFSTTGTLNLGSVAAGKKSVMTFISDGLNGFCECSRTTAY